MKNLNEDGLDPLEELKASSELLKLKLGLEYEMKLGDTSSMSPELENLWLNSIYKFENEYKKRRTIKVYDVLKNPSFPKYDTLTKEELHLELEKLLALMETYHMALGCCCEYDETTIYRFITEELFEHETDGIFVEGMVQHFIYEEFHPNHEYSIRQRVEDFIDVILRREWKEEWDIINLTKEVSFNDLQVSRNLISAMILEFQEAHLSFEIKSMQIKKINFDLDKNTGYAKGFIKYHANPHNDKSRNFEGPFIIDLECQSSHWNISGFKIPGIDI
ncbi:MAG: hypothetical protein HOP08_19610 [Cyclobacteriaceae bacterium]|nr:hypothetical protein [Cyclobacteriaceae bacterium]